MGVRQIARVVEGDVISIDGRQAPSTRARCLFAEKNRPNCLASPEAGGRPAKKTRVTAAAQSYDELADRAEKRLGPDKAQP
jgi:hypothetical protein